MGRFAIFDLDGTLLNSLQDLADACNYSLKKNGFPVHPANSYKYFVGDGILTLINRALPENFADESAAASVKADFDDFYSVHSLDKTVPYTGISETLTKLKENNIKLAVLSNKPHEYVKFLTDTYFPGLISFSYGQRAGVPIKPDPAAVFEIIGLLDNDISDGFYIGDTSTDMQTGKNSGLYTIGVSWGFRTKDELESAGADIIINKASELIKIIVDK